MTESSESTLSYLSSFFNPVSFEAQGQLLHPNGDPFYEQTLKLYRRVLFFKFPLATATTDKEGRFSFNYQIKRLPISGQNLLIEVVEEKLKSPQNFFYTAKTQPVYSLFANHTFTQKKVDLKILEAKLYEYQEELPVLQPPSSTSKDPQFFDFSYFYKLFTAVIDERIKRFFYTEVDTDASIQKIIDAFGIDKTLDHTEKSTIEMIFNGIYPCTPLKTQEPGIYKVDVNLKGYDKKIVPVIPDATLYFKLEKQGPIVKEIHLDYPYVDTLVVKKGDKDFLKALYHFNCAAFFKGELSKHLAIGHLATEQYAMAVFRHLNDHPIGRLLKPHLREVMRINQLGASAIFGENGVLAKGPLTQKGVIEHLKDELRVIDYHQFKPQETLYPNHRFAIAGQCYWKLLEESVSLFFKENKITSDNPDTIRQWYQIYYLSKSLVEHCPANRPQDNVFLSERVDTNEAFNPEQEGRVYLNGELKPITPITLNKDKPSEEDIQKLKEFCIHAIYQATFYHWWLHSSQNIWGTQLHLASLAPQAYGSLPYGNTHKEAALHQTAVAKALTDFEGGVLLENPNGDIYPALITKLRHYKDYFLALGLNVNELAYGTII